MGSVLNYQRKLVSQFTLGPSGSSVNTCNGWGYNPDGGFKRRPSSKPLEVHHCCPCRLHAHVAGARGKIRGMAYGASRSKKCQGKMNTFQTSNDLPTTCRPVHQLARSQSSTFPSLVELHLSILFSVVLSSVSLVYPSYTLFFNKI